MDKALNYLAIARKAGALVPGEENTGQVVRAGKARLLVLASDASANAQVRAERFLTGHSALLLTLPYTKAQLAELLGGGDHSMAAVTDLGLAKSLTEALAQQDSRFQEAAAELARRLDKAKRRKQESKQADQGKNIGKRRSKA